MSKEKQILQCWGAGYSHQQTASALGVSRNTVRACRRGYQTQYLRLNKFFSDRQ